MKPAFQINLIRHKVDSMPARIIKHLVMCGYLLFCSALLVATAHLTTARLIQAGKQVREKTNLEVSFDLAYPDETDRKVYCRVLEEGLRTENQRLMELGTIIRKKVDVAGILLRLALPLPHGIHIMSCAFDEEKSSFQLALVVPLKTSDPSRSSPTQLIRNWSEDPILMSKVRNISSVLSERLSVSGEEAFVYRFACTLNPGGAE